MNTPKQVVQAKPVATVGTTTVLAVAVLNYLAYRGWVPASLDEVLTPVVVLVLGVAVHALVSPYQKVRSALERDGLLSDADFGRLEVLVEDQVRKALSVPPAAPQLPSPGSSA
jgi:hypothetical protein